MPSNEILFSRRAAGLKIFISHISEERPFAEVLKSEILKAFAGQVSVFVASDKVSIPGGAPWYQQITEELRASNLVLVLVSHASKGRPWINFEAGYGAGRNLRVIPIAIRDFNLGQLDFPLAGLQGRSSNDLTNILSDVGKALGLQHDKPDLTKYQQSIEEAEKHMAYKDLEVTPYIVRDWLHFEFKNTGNRDLEVLMFEAWIPKALLGTGWAPYSNPLFHYEDVQLGEYPYAWVACTSKRGEFGNKTSILRPVFTPGMGTVSMSGILIPLKSGLGWKEQQWELKFRMHLANYPNSIESVRYHEVENRA